MILRRISFFSLLFCLGMFQLPEAEAQTHSLPFRRISPAGGFTLNPVIKIAQDKHGFIWFNTREKLYQYNSQDFISFEPKFEPGFAHNNNYITSMLIDRSNTIWVGSNVGMMKFNEKTWQMEAVRLRDSETPDRILFINDIRQNKQGEIWVIANSTLALLDSASMKLNFVGDGKGRITANGYCFDQDGNFYVANNLGELYFVQRDTHAVTKFKVDISPTKIYNIYLINNLLWVSTDGYGLQRYTREGKFVDSYFTKRDITNSYSSRIRDIIQTSNGQIWIATYKGLLAWHENNFTQYLADYDNEFSLPDNSVNTLLEDQQKGLWIGTWRGGVGYLNSYANTFETYRMTANENSISGNLVNAISEDSRGAIWIGTDGQGQGLDVFNDQRKIFQHIPLKGNKNNSFINVKCICHSKSGDSWLGTFGEGVFRKRYGESDFRQFMLDDLKIYDLADGGDGLWIATFGNGLYFYQYKDQTITQFPNSSPLGVNIRKLLVDSYNNLWVISTAGLFMKQAGKPIFEQISLDNETDIGSTQVYSFATGQNQLVWIGTDRGLFSIDAARSIRHFPIYFNGKPVTVYGIIITGNESIWLSSNSGIFYYNILTGNTLNYGIDDGLHGNLFNSGAFCQSSSGKIYFGSTTGLVAFNPATMRVNPFQPKVYFTKMYINHKEILPGQANSPLDKPLYEIGEIHLQSGQNSFGIEFVAQNYLNPQKNQFRYRLKGFDPNWVDTGSLSKATYTNVPPGEYVFEVVACNNDMVWNMKPAALNIIISRPLLLSIPAITIYVFLILAIGFLVWRIILYRTRLVHQIEIERLQRLEEEKSHQNKLNFFTNISHELRTPLTLITGPVESLMKTSGLEQGTFNQLSLIKRNTGRLLKLINQLLEFRQIEENKTALSLVQTDVVKFVKEIYDYFIDVAKQKDINYVFVSMQEQISLTFDTEKIDKAVFNLLSNAFKFTPERGTISVEISQGNKLRLAQGNTNAKVIGSLKCNDYIQIQVKDSGPGIAREFIEKVFDRFYRIENEGIPHSGTGIGLHLTKHLILLHGGEIELESELGQGSVFTLRLPYDESDSLGIATDVLKEAKPVIHPSHEDNFNNESDEIFEDWNQEEKGNKKGGKLVLVVEDNHDLSRFICHALEEEFRLLVAFNGTEGVRKAQAYLPDLIISDVMMPGKSGIEMMRELKGDLKTSHIPILLLTALTSVENKIEGFSSGADDYIEKPFNSEVLKARIKNIFAGRVALQGYYSKKMAIGFDGDLPDNPDQKMMAKAISYVEKNLQDENLDIEMLASHLNLSQSTLYRKLKALTGKSATDFIRTIRLEYAARLLRDESYNIEEVSGLAGFNSHSYFSRSFREHFGMSPSEYLSMH